jgi:outer membrane protein assembly factor BamB
MVALVALLAFGGSSGTAATKAGGDWTRFGYDAARSSSGPAATGITAANAGKLVRQRVVLDGTVDSSPIYLRAVRVAGRTRDVFFVTTTYGKTLAVDAASGRIVWRFTPAGYKSFAATSQITTATPAADPSRRWIYAASAHEKIAASLNFARGLVLLSTGGYIGDAPPYQGHVVAITAASGRIAHAWNSLCSDRGGLLTPSSCPESGSAIWGRAGVVVAPGTGNLLVATGDGRFDGSRYWGDSVLMLSPTAARLLQNWTPVDQKALEDGDVDLGSTAPAVLSSRFAVQSGKDGRLRLLDLRRLNGRGVHGTRTGGELQTLELGEGLFSAPAVWHHGGTTWLFVSTFASTRAYRLAGSRLTQAWATPVGGTSPVVAGGLLYVYDPSRGLNVYRATSGALVTRLQTGAGHWNSPIVTDGRVALPEGNANDHVLSGVLDIYRLRR